MHTVAWLGAFVSAFALAACERASEPPAPDVRPVRTTTVEAIAGGEALRLTGRIEAAEEVNLAFRVGQRLLERSVGVGDRVTPGLLVARLESTTFENAVRTARANLAAANARLVDARLEFERQRSMLERGVAARATYERAVAARDSALAQMDAARAELDTASEHLSFTALHSDSAGVVVAVGAEPGEVVGAGQTIVRIAREGGRDAVFDVPSRVKESAVGLDPEVTVVLASNPDVRTDGRVREVSPRSDPVTGTFSVRVGLSDPPDAMRLGSTVIGSVPVGFEPGLRIPASALTAAEGQPAVFVFDPDTGSVSTRPIEIEAFGVAELTVAQGLAPGDIVVTAGVQSLRPGQKVRLLQDRR